ncbi:MAG: hypothetical protein ABS52_01590 [Gemmatimonadetes bacterium SCN 70-22]|nr:MAG: hypothetical protein ABS52_01590 [Gemmatimonadetes bacterium SCN 70-22]
MDFDARLQQLFEEFRTDYLLTADGSKHRQAYASGRQSARANLGDITARADRREEVTDLVLARLLPHIDSARHREDGSWIHVAPAINKDIKSWYEGAGWATKSEWPARAAHILTFIRRVVDQPSELADACRQFSASPLGKALQCGMMTPILSALRPDDFSIVNTKVCRLLKEVTGKDYTSALKNYPDTNAAIHELVARHDGLFGTAQQAGVSALEAFDMMAHWFVAVREDDADEQGKGVDRTSADAARRVVETLCPDSAPRAAALGTLAQAIRFAHELGPQSWSITLKSDLVRLNVGGLIAVDLRKQGLAMTVAQDEMPLETIQALSDAEHWEFKYMDHAVCYLLPYDELDPAVGQLGPAMEEHLRRVTTRTQFAPFRTAHSPGVLTMLRQLKYEVPDPEYAAPPAPGGRIAEPLPGQGASTGAARQPRYSLQDLARETLMDEALLGSWVRAINRKGQAIIYGPPGTGKTYVAERLCRHLVSGGDGAAELVQFHPAYAYEDFIQGLRPETNANGALSYRMIPGRFMEFCERAARASGPSVLIIDEINRANLAQVFGELMYLLEYRDREVPLAGGARLRIPPNVRIIGTMNTADRSIALVDHALRRRFAFLHLLPNHEILERYHVNTSLDVSKLCAVLSELNAAIADPHYAVGISYFLRDGLAEELPMIWESEIEPYIEELFFDRADEIAKFRWSAVKSRATPELIA